MECLSVSHHDCRQHPNRFQCPSFHSGVYQVVQWANAGPTAMKPKYPALSLARFAEEHAHYRIPTGFNVPFPVCKPGNCIPRVMRKLRDVPLVYLE